MVVFGSRNEVSIHTLISVPIFLRFGTAAVVRLGTDMIGGVTLARTNRGAEHAPDKHDHQCNRG